MRRVLQAADVDPRRDFTRAVHVVRRAEPELSTGAAILLLSPLLKEQP
ncbi:hypothetical protein [Streptomyces sp. NBC_01465]|nr:hypothetical protein [Streptomyces sp. NBC_01465]